MRIVWDAPIEMSDGIVLRADVFRPIGESTIPAILSYGPYAKECLSRKVARSHGSG
jgi:predicted acyl esterase